MAGEFVARMEDVLDLYAEPPECDAAARDEPGGRHRRGACAGEGAGPAVPVRHINLLERTFGESRRQLKVIGRLPGERNCLSLVWAVLDRTSRGWSAVELTPAGVRLLQELRRELFHPPRASVTRRVARTVRAAEHDASTGSASGHFFTRDGTPP